jgi:hypothetical protein
MSLNNRVVHLNPGKFEIEGSFDLTSGAAVTTLTVGLGTKTVRGQHMSVVKNTTGTYDVTVKLASTLDGQPVFQAVELLDADAHIIATTVATALDARVASVTIDTSGNMVIRVLTVQTTGAAADTTAAITVSFDVKFAYERFDQMI